MPEQKRLWIIPLSVGTIILVLVIALWWSLILRERSTIQERARIEATRLLSFIKTDLYDRSLRLERMARRWEIRGGTPKNEFIQDAKQYYDDFPGFQAIEWVDTSFKIRWIVPEEGNEKVRDLKITFEKNRREAVEKAKTLKTPTLSSPLTLIQNNKKGLQFYVPLYVRGQFDGFVVGVFKIDDWLNNILIKNETEDEKINYIVGIAIDNQMVLQQESDENLAKKISATENTLIFDHILAVTVWPTDLFIAATSNLIPTFTLFIGIFISFLITIVIYLFQKSSIETKNAILIGKQLKTTSEALTVATKAGKIGIWTWNLSTNKLTWNDIMYEIYGLHKTASPIYETWSNALHPEDKAATEKQLSDAVQGRGVYDTQFRIVHPNGEIHYVQAAASIQRDRHGLPHLVTGTNIDVTHQVLTEQRLAAEKQKLDYTIEGTDIGTWEWNVQTGEAKYNDRWAEIVGYTLAELSPITIKTWQYLCHPEDFEQSTKLLEKHFHHETDHYDCEVRMKHKNGNWVWVHDRGKVATWTSDNKPLMMYGTHQEITERKKNEEEIYHQANYDLLTGLPVRKFAEDQMSLLIATANRKQKLVAVLFIDLDGFKFVNDNYGHHAGDILLKEIAQRLTACVRKNDIVARIGGDEFLVILSELNSKENVAQVAKMIIGQVASPVHLDSATVTISASVGIAMYPDDAPTAKALVELADKAMYEIKHAGKNNYLFVSKAMTSKSQHPR